MALQDSKTILLVEDNEDDEHLTLNALRKHNVMNEVVVVCDGQHAADYLFREGSYSQSRHEPPSLILLDLGLPKLSGLELLREIRMRPSLASVPIVVFTSSPDPGLVESVYAAGANSFVRKPSSPVEYQDSVLSIAMYWLLLNQSPRLVPSG